MTQENNEEDVFNGYGIKIKLKTDFNRVREVLTRIGIANKDTKVITQSCHIFHKRGEYAIMHFLEMFLFDNKTANFSTIDENRRDKVANLLAEWGYIEILDDVETPVDNVPLTIVSRKMIEEEKWTKVAKYTIGK